jgi:tRNA pseudouridine13 synthase
LPEDFTVEEILDAPILKKGNFGLYQLQKTNENTIDCIKKIADELHVSFSSISYGGRKDRHSLSQQYITIECRRHPLGLKHNNYSLKFLGFLNRPMGPDLIQGNRFSIVVRDLNNEETTKIEAEIPLVNKFGYPNFYDDQRFGSYDTIQGFLAEKILKNHYNGALKIYLTRFNSDDRKESKEKKKFYYDHWGQWEACLKKSSEYFEKEAFNQLISEPKSFLPILKKIPHEELALFFSAFQAFLWNEVLKIVLLDSCPKPLSTYPGLLGDYIFYMHLNEKQYQFLINLKIPTVASKIETLDKPLKTILEGVLAQYQLKLPMFNLTKIRQAYFKSFERLAVITPLDFRYAILKDDIFEGRNKAFLSFTLPRGAFATMLVKRIFFKSTLNEEL